MTHTSLRSPREHTIEPGTKWAFSKYSLTVKSWKRRFTEQEMVKWELERRGDLGPSGRGLSTSKAGKYGTAWVKNARDTKHDHAKGIGPPGGQVPAYKAPGGVFWGVSSQRTAQSTGFIDRQKLENLLQWLSLHSVPFTLTHGPYLISNVMFFWANTSAPNLCLVFLTTALPPSSWVVYQHEFIFSQHFWMGGWVITSAPW